MIALVHEGNLRRFAGVSASGSPAPKSRAIARDLEARPLWATLGYWKRLPLRGKPNNRFLKVAWFAFRLPG
jgi:hypothetical protein